jgi:hypothetical protein
MKAFKRARHHHHQRLSALLIQYAHLDLEQKLEAFGRDVGALADIIDRPEAAARVLEQLLLKLRVHR